MKRCNQTDINSIKINQCLTYVSADYQILCKIPKCFSQKTVKSVHLFILRISHNPFNCSEIGISANLFNWRCHDSALFYLFTFIPENDKSLPFSQSADKGDKIQTLARVIN